MYAPDRFVLYRSAAPRFAPSRYAPSRFASPRSTPPRFAPYRYAPDRFTPALTAASTVRRMVLFTAACSNNTRSVRQHVISILLSLMASILPNILNYEALRVPVRIPSPLGYPARSESRVQLFHDVVEAFPFLVIFRLPRQPKAELLVIPAFLRVVEVLRENLLDLGSVGANAICHALQADGVADELCHFFFSPASLLFCHRQADHSNMLFVVQ